MRQWWLQQWWLQWWQDDVLLDQFSGETSDDQCRLTQTGAAELVPTICYQPTPSTVARGGRGGARLVMRYHLLSVTLTTLISSQLSWVSCDSGPALDKQTQQQCVRSVLNNPTQWIWEQSQFLQWIIAGGAILMHQLCTTVTVQLHHQVEQRKFPSYGWFSDRTKSSWHWPTQYFQIR